MKMMKMCLHPKVLLGLVAVGAGVYLLAPGAFAAAVPLLIIAVCPLSMVVMMTMMGRVGGGARPPRDGEPATEADVRAELAQLQARQEDLHARLAPRGARQLVRRQSSTRVSHDADVRLADRAER